MKPGLKIGSQGQLNWIVDPTMTISLGGLPRATVFSTPNMIMLMERAAREALRPFLDQDEESVGTEVQVEHVDAATMGEPVRGIAKVVDVSDRKVQFEVNAYSGEREIGRGKHRRTIIQLSRFMDKLNQTMSSETGTAKLEARYSAQRSNQPNTSAHTLKSIVRTNELIELQTLKVVLQNQVATVTLNRPKSLNAVNVQMTMEFEAVIAWLMEHAEQCRVVILTGAGDAFCSGDDVKELESLSLEEARALSIRQANVYLAFERVPQPVIAAVNGTALGAGCVAAYSCDFRLAAFSSKFGMPEIRLGWPPGYGISQLMALVGKSRALEMCLLGESISANTALDWGLVNEVVANNQLMRRAQELSFQLLKMPAEALRATKRLIHADEGSLAKVTHLADTDAYIRCLDTPDAREGVLAFTQKRTPRFMMK